ncbi:MAG: hypothetical protein IJT64_04235 [Kiritimatiellae bacterium]|nr:hypothetical protein [Kiritimatiellia bacterium]
MKRQQVIRCISAAAVAAALMCGCATAPLPPQPGSGTGFILQGDLEKCQVAMPPNANTQNFRKLGLAVQFQNITGVDKKTGKPLKVDPNLSKRLQVEMGKMKRYTIVDLHSDNGFLGDMADAGLANVVEGEQRQIDLLLSGSITLVKEIHDLHDYTMLKYVAEFDFICKDLKDGTQKFAEKASGTAYRKQFWSIAGGMAGGFREEDEAGVCLEAAMKAISVVANKIVNTYPAGGRIISCTASGERMTLDRGFEQGIAGNQQCVVFVDDEGTKVPLCYARAEPSDNTSGIIPYRWDTVGKDAVLLKKKFDMDPKSFIRNYETYAVGYGVPSNPMDLK